jgi:lysophospholipase L1-like esterase
MKPFTFFAAALVFLGLLLVAGCSKEAPEGPVPGLGGNTVNRYVALGNSFTAGYQSNGLYKSAQDFSYPNLIAHQLRAAGSMLPQFEQPNYSDPGNADPKTGKAARYEIISLTPSIVIGPRGLPPGAPLSLSLNRPYDNLGVPGSVIFDFLDTTNYLAKAGPPRNNPFFSLVLRSSSFGRNMLAQARLLAPDLVTFWFGNNDVLGFAASGGVSPSAPTPAGTFAALYTQALDSLRAALPSAKIVVGNVPDVRAMPLFTTVGPRMKAALPAGVYLRYQKHGNTLGFDSTRFVEAVPPLIPLTGQAYASLLGQPTGAWYRQNGIPIPAGIDTTKPFGLHPFNPWPDALILDEGEQATALSATQAFNNTIAMVAAAKNCGLVDAYSIMAHLATEGYTIAGLKFTAVYVSGGFFSLDGVNPSSRGHGIMANEFIKVMNAKFGMSIPYVDVAAIPGIPAPVEKSVDEMNLRVDPQGLRQIPWLLGQVE